MIAMTASVEPHVDVMAGWRLRASQERWLLVQQALRIIERQVAACAVLDREPHVVWRAARIERRIEKLIKILDAESSRLTIELAMHDRAHRAASRKSNRG